MKQKEREKHRMKERLWQLKLPRGLWGVSVLMVMLIFRFKYTDMSLQALGEWTHIWWMLTTNVTGVNQSFTINSHIPKIDERDVIWPTHTQVSSLDSYIIFYNVNAVSPHLKGDLETCSLFSIHSFLWGMFSNYEEQTAAPVGPRQAPRRVIHSLIAHKDTEASSALWDRGTAEEHRWWTHRKGQAPPFFSFYTKTDSRCCKCFLLFQKYKLYTLLALTVYTLTWKQDIEPLSAHFLLLLHIQTFIKWKYCSMCCTKTQLWCLALSLIPCSNFHSTPVVLFFIYFHCQ